MMFRNDLKKYILQGSLGVFLTKITGVLLAFFTSIVLARTLTVKEFGIYSFALETMLFVSFPVSKGFSNLLTREIARYRFNKQYRELKGILKWALKYLSIILIIVTIVTALCIVFFVQSEIKMVALTFALPIIVINGLGQARMGSLRGLKKTIKSQLPDTVIRHTIIITLVYIVSQILSISINTLFVIGITIISFLISFTVGSLWLYSAIPIESKKVRALVKTREWYKESLPFLLLGSIGIINSKFSLIIVGLIQPVANVGFYKIAVTASTIISFLLFAINMSIAPLIAELYKQNKKQLQIILTKTVRYTFCVGVLFSIVYFLYGKSLLGFFYGNEYLPAYYPLIILSIGQLINIGAGSVANVLNMTGNQKFSLIGQLAAMCVNLLLNIILVPKFGIIGASIATSTSFFIWNAVLLYFVKERTGLKTAIF